MRYCHTSCTHAQVGDISFCYSTDYHGQDGRIGLVTQQAPKAKLPYPFIEKYKT